MKDLSRESRALLDEVRRVEHLSPNDKARIHSKLSHRMGAGLALGTALTASATVAEAAHTGALAAVVAWLPAAAKVVSMVAIAGAVGVGAVKVAHVGSPSVPASMPVPARAVVKAAPHAQAAPLPTPTAAASTLADVTASQPTPEPTAVRVQTLASASKQLAVAAPPAARVLSVQRAEVPPLAGDHLANQVAAIRTARVAIRSGDARSAIAALDREFPEGQAGALAPEAALARVAAYCRLGQVQAARHTVDRFSVQFPDSPLVARMRDSCVGEAGRNP